MTYLSSTYLLLMLVAGPSDNVSCDNHSEVRMEDSMDEF